MRVVPMMAAVAAIAMGAALGGDVSRPEVARNPAVTLLVADSTLGYAREISMGFAAGVAQVPGVAQRVLGSAVGDTTHQLAAAREVLGQARSGVSLFTWNPELLAQPLAAARADGTEVIAVHTPPPPGSGIRLYVGNDDYALGQMLGQQLATMIPPGMQGTVVLGAAVPGTLALDRRSAGVRDWLNRVCPRLTVLGPFDTKQDPAASREAWTTLVRANPHAVAFVGIGDTDAATLAGVRAAAGGQWVAGGFGLDDAALQAVRTGTFALVSPELFVQGAVAGRLQAAAARGDALPEGWLVTPGLAIEPDDVSWIRTRQLSARLRVLSADGEIDDLVTNASAHLRPLADASLGQNA
jgi:ribose transport system substrate-binding protein